MFRGLQGRGLGDPSGGVEGSEEAQGSNWILPVMEIVFRYFNDGYRAIWLCTGFHQPCTFDM